MKKLIETSETVRFKEYAFSLLEGIKNGYCRYIRFGSDNNNSFSRSVGCGSFYNKSIITEISTKELFKSKKLEIE